MPGVTHLALESISAAVLQAPEPPRVLTLVVLTNLVLDCHDTTHTLRKWQRTISFPVHNFFRSSLDVSLICLYAATSFPPGPTEVAKLGFATASTFHPLASKDFRRPSLGLDTYVM